MDRGRGGRGREEAEDAVFDLTLWSAIADRAPVPIAGLYGPAHIFRYANSAFCRLLGRTGKQLTGRTFSESMWQADLCLPLLDRVYRCGHAETYTEPECAGSGPSHLSLMMWPVLGQGARPVGVMIQGMESPQLLPRPEAPLKEAMRRDGARFRAVANAVPGVVWSADGSGAPEFFNDLWYRFTGLTPEQSLGERGSLQAVHPEDRKRVWQAWRSAVAIGSPFEIEFRLRRASDGSYRWHLARGVPMRDREGKIEHWFGICTDIDHFLAAQEALVRTEKLASIGRMAISLAHRINNPLEAVTNALYLAQRAQGMPGTALEYLRVAEEELRRVSHAARQSLGFYNESSSPTKFSVSSLLDSVCDLLRARINVAGVRIEKQCDRRLSMTGIPGELTQVLSNLLANSLDAVNENGRITLRAGISSGGIGRERHVRLTVADDGAGIDEEALRHVFDPFFSTKGSVATGLGLWVSKRLIEKHGGSIRVRSSTKGFHRGTAFSIVLPVEPVNAKGP